VRAPDAQSVLLCLFDAAGQRETARHAMRRADGGAFALSLPEARAGLRYGYRADGPYDPDRGLWFDPNKLLADPYATRIDRPWRIDPRLGLPRGQSVDTAPLVPKCIAENLPKVSRSPAFFKPGGMLYEVNARGYSMRDEAIPQDDRGTLRAFRHEVVLERLRRLHVAAVEFMPLAAWIDERHLPALGLANAWGYNPVTFMALDPRLAPNGWADLGAAVAALHAAGIGAIVDVVFNHTGESDRHGPTLSQRGLDNRAWYRHAADGSLVNDTGCGNTIACDNPAVRAAIVETLRRYVIHAGVDGFRFDLATTLGRHGKGFAENAQTLKAIAADPLLADRALFAEPWDIGPDGYRLGRFPPRFREWNDRFRDDVRRFWRGDAGAAADFATRISGSSDIFSRPRTRSVNFIASHDGFTLADLVSHARKHNEANGEANRDGHNGSVSWNCGVEGAASDISVVAARDAARRALLASLFVSRGTILVAAGDEFGRTQGGNNNAYAQDNEITWLDWDNRDRALEDFVAALARLRASMPALASEALLTGQAMDGASFPDGVWLDENGKAVEPGKWRDPGPNCLMWLISTGDAAQPRLAVLFNRSGEPVRFILPAVEGCEWRDAMAPGIPGMAMAWSVGIALLHKFGKVGST
jgi:glycogen operon protein